MLSGAGLVDRSDFLTLVADPPPATAATSGTISLAVPPIVASRSGRSLEGYLYPDTYRFAPTAGAKAALEKLLATFAQKAPADLEARAQAIGLSAARKPSRWPRSSSARACAPTSCPRSPAST
ncbi:MAG: hypothetical protein U0470_09285 [Anaerolineae bacterium]